MSQTIRVEFSLVVLNKGGISLDRTRTNMSTETGQVQWIAKHWIEENSISNVPSTLFPFAPLFHLAANRYARRAKC